MRMRVRLEFKLADLWVGVFWKWREPTWKEDALDVWLCLVPCVPIHLIFYWRGAQ